MAALTSNWNCDNCGEKNKINDPNCKLCDEPKEGVMRASIPEIISIIKGLNLQSMLDSRTNRQIFSNEVGLSETNPDVVGLTHPREDLDQMSVHYLAKAKQDELDDFARSFMGYIIKKKEISKIMATHIGNMSKLNALKKRKIPDLLNRNELEMVQSMTEVTKNPDYIAADEEGKKSMLEDVKTVVESRKEYQNIKLLLQVEVPKLLILVEHSKKKYFDELKLQQDLKNDLINEIFQHMKDEEDDTYTKKDAENLFFKYIDIYENRQPKKKEILLWTDTLQSLINLCEGLKIKENELLMSEIEKERRKIESEKAELAQKDILQEEKREIESEEEKKRIKKEKNKRKKQRQKTRKKKEAERAAKQEPLHEPEQKKDSQVETAITLVKSFNLETILDETKFKNLTDFISIINILLDEERVGSLIGEQVAIVSAPIVAAEIEKRMGEDREDDQKFWQDFGFVIVDDGIPLPMYLLEFFLDFKGLISHKAYREYVTSKKNRPMLINIIKNFQALWKGAKINDKQAGMLLDKLAASMNPDSIVNKWYVELQSINQTLTLIGDRGVAKPKKKKKKKKNKKKTKKKKISDKEEGAPAPAAPVEEKTQAPAALAAVAKSKDVGMSKEEEVPLSLLDKQLISRIIELYEYLQTQDIFNSEGKKRKERMKLAKPYQEKMLECIISELIPRLERVGIGLVVTGGFATHLLSNGHYVTEDIDIKVYNISESRDIYTMRKIVKEVIIKTKLTRQGFQIYDPVAIEYERNASKGGEMINNGNIPLKITAKINSFVSDYRNDRNPTEYDAISEITYNNITLYRDVKKQYIEGIPIQDRISLIDNLLNHATINFQQRLDAEERNIYPEKILGWFKQLQELLRQTTKSNAVEVMEIELDRIKSLSSKQGGRRKTRKRRKKKRKTKKRKKPRKKRKKIRKKRTRRK